jgi:hypothetical protein
MTVDLKSTPLETPRLIVEGGLVFYCSFFAHILALWFYKRVSSRSYVCQYGFDVIQFTPDERLFEFLGC